MSVTRFFSFLAGIFLLSRLVFAGEFLPPDQAFRFESQQQQSELQLRWEIEHGYYLYKERIHLYSSEGEEAAELPFQFSSESQIKEDRNFGKVAVFFDKASLMVDLAALDEVTSGRVKSLWIEYQGCSKDGLCYQPQIKEITLQPFAVAAAASPAPSAAEGVNLDELDNTTSISGFLAKADLLTTLGVFFLLGLGLSLTPCILPMIPILSGIIVGQGKELTTRQGIVLSSSYVLGMAVTYALAGMAAATFGAKGNLQLYMQQPWVVVLFALVFVALSLSMFGFYNLALPSRLQNSLYNLSNKQKGGQASGVFVMGALSALVVSPCVSAPLAGALMYISSTGDKLIGGSALFVLAIGLGMPLIAIGAGGGKLVPRAGVWMNQVKEFFGVVLLGVAIWLLSRVIPAAVSLLLWAALLIGYAIHAGALEPAGEGHQRMKKALAFMLLFYGCILFAGSFLGGKGPLQPIVLPQVSGAGERGAAQQEGLSFQRVQNLAELNAAIAVAHQQNRPVMLDFYADWCTACIDMEKNVFNRKPVHELLSGYTLLQIDLTKNSPEHQALLDSFGLFGPPSILFFDAAGKEIAGKRIQGELDAEDFSLHVTDTIGACAYQSC
jgi:thiol:disulfide interchange protein DsbD